MTSCHTFLSFYNKIASRLSLLAYMVRGIGFAPISRSLRLHGLSISPTHV
nr:MAG TPA: hypothetical protein [Caudoviricetes sp.]